MRGGLVSLTAPVMLAAGVELVLVLGTAALPVSLEIVHTLSGGVYSNIHASRRGGRRRREIHSRGVCMSLMIRQHREGRGERREAKCEG